MIIFSKINNKKEWNALSETELVLHDASGSMFKAHRLRTANYDGSKVNGFLFVSRIDCPEDKSKNKDVRIENSSIIFKNGLMRFSEADNEYEVYKIYDDGTGMHRYTFHNV